MNKTQQLIAAIEADHNYGCEKFEDIYEIIAGYADMGLSQKDVSEIYQVPPTSFRHGLLAKVDPDKTIKWRLHGRTPVYDDVTVRKARHMYRSGLEVGAVARALDIPFDTVNYWLVQGGRVSA